MKTVGARLNKIRDFEKELRQREKQLQQAEQKANTTVSKMLAKAKAQNKKSLEEARAQKAAVLKAAQALLDQARVAHEQAEKGVELARLEAEQIRIEAARTGEEVMRDAALRREEMLASLRLGFAQMEQERDMKEKEMALRVKEAEQALTNKEHDFRLWALSLQNREEQLLSRENELYQLECGLREQKNKAREKDLLAESQLRELSSERELATAMKARTEDAQNKRSKQQLEQEKYLQSLKEKLQQYSTELQKKEEKLREDQELFGKKIEEVRSNLAAKEKQTEVDLLELARLKAVNVKWEQQLQREAEHQSTENRRLQNWGRDLELEKTQVEDSFSELADKQKKLEQYLQPFQNS